LEQTTSGRARGLHGDASRSITATGFGARWNNQQRVRVVYALCLWPMMQCSGVLGGSRDFKARSTAKEHTNEVQSGGRDLGVSRPPLDMGNCCVVAFRHGALNW